MPPAKRVRAEDIATKMGAREGPREGELRGSRPRPKARKSEAKAKVTSKANLSHISTTGGKGRFGERFAYASPGVTSAVST
jgi:hypothetical protein